MPLDIYAGNKVEHIEHSEEYIFSLINKDENFPTLSLLWNDYYSDPQLTANDANLLVHELLLLIDENMDVRTTRLIIRLSKFFSYSFKNNIDLKCISD